MISGFNIETSSHQPFLPMHHNTCCNPPLSSHALLTFIPMPCNSTLLASNRTASSRLNHDVTYDHMVATQKSYNLLIHLPHGLQCITLTKPICTAVQFSSVPSIGLSASEGHRPHLAPAATAQPGIRPALGCHLLSFHPTKGLPTG